MGMNVIVAHEIWKLWKAGVFSDHRSVLEFSPHDLGTSTESPTVYIDLARQWFTDRAAVDTFAANAFAPDGTRRPDAHEHFYRLFGFDDYTSVDFLDERATIKADFNVPVEFSRRYDIAAEYGTGEHIFNIGQFFANVYNSLRPGGIALHFLPTMGQIHHGFYNIHSILFRSLAAAGLYDLLSLAYVPVVPNVVSKAEKRCFVPDMEDIRFADARHTTLRFYLADIFAALTGRPRCAAMVFAALRKVDDKPFRFPQQINKYWQE
jgi:SAM-dependent methyltransferase